MTKQEVKDLGEGDAQLQWWAMVLFAEICELTEMRKQGYKAESLFSRVEDKVAEWDRLVQKRMIEIAKGDHATPGMEERIAALEAWRATMEPSR